MSQGSNFKSQVMEALFNAPTNLINNKAIMWALSNLPEEGGMGKESTVVRGEYNHESESFWSAIGMPDKDMERIHDKFRDHLFEYVRANKDNVLTKSMVFQHMEKVCGYEGILYMAVHGFMKHYEALKEAETAGSVEGFLKMMDGLSEDDIHKASVIHDLVKKLEELKKRLGGDK